MKTCPGGPIVAVDRRIHRKTLPCKVVRDRTAERLKANVRALRPMSFWAASGGSRPHRSAKPGYAFHAPTSMQTLFMRLRFQHGRCDNLKTLHPAYFALVMATGIVSIATHLHGIPVLPAVLFWLNALFLSGLVAATGARILRYPRAFAVDIQSHNRGVGFFTTVAATAVFGTQLVLQLHAPKVATAFWIAAGVLWFVTTYGVLAVLTVNWISPVWPTALMVVG